MNHNDDNSGVYNIIAFPDGEIRITTNPQLTEKEKADIRIAVIEKGVAEVRPYEFAYCRNLEKVIIPDTVKVIRENAFYACTSLKTIELPQSIEKIEYSAFRDCTSLETILIPEGVRSIEYGTFFGCVSLHSVYIPESVTEIDNYGFRNCRSLKKIIGGRGITRIGGQAFDGCSSLSELPFMPRLLYLADDALQGTTNPDRRILTSRNSENTINVVDNTLYIPNEIEVLANGSIGEKRENVVLPVHLRSISPYAFLSNRNITEPYSTIAMESLPKKMKKPSSIFGEYSVFNYSMCFFLIDTLWKDEITIEDYIMILLHHPNENAKSEVRRRMSKHPSHTFLKIKSMIHGDVFQMEEAAKYAAAYLPEISSNALSRYRRTARIMSADRGMEIIERERIVIQELIPEKYSQYRNCIGTDGLEPFFASEFFSRHDLKIRGLNYVKFMDGTSVPNNLVLSVLYAYTKQAWAGLPGVPYTPRSYSFYVCEKADTIAELFEKESFKQIFDFYSLELYGIFIPAVCRYGDQDAILKMTENILQLTDRNNPYCTFCSDDKDKENGGMCDYVEILKSALCLSDKSVAAASYDIIEKRFFSSGGQNDF